MACSKGKRASSCPGCKETEDFQKIIELKDIGLTIYRYTPPENDMDNQIKTNQKCNTVSRITEDIFIVHNTKSINITASQCTSDLKSNEIRCLRCRKILEHAQKLLQYIPTIEKNEVRGFCDYCLMKQRTCDDCENVMKKFISNQKELSADTKKQIKNWLVKMNQILEVEQIIDSAKRRRAKSDISIDRLKSPERDRVLNLKDYKTDLIRKTKLHDNLSTIDQAKNQELEERPISEQPSTARLYNSHLKEKRLKIIEHIPPARQQSVAETSKKSKSQYPYVEPIDIDHDFDDKYVLQRHGTSKTLIKEHDRRVFEEHKDEILTGADKIKTELSKLRRFFSEESLLTVAATSSKSELLKKNFTFYFPKKTKAKRTRKFQSSSELIKTTRDQLEERKEQRREMKKIYKLEAEKEKEREDKKALFAAKKRDDNEAMEEKRSIPLYKSVDEREKGQDEEDRKSDYVARESTGERRQKGKQEETEVREGKGERGSRGERVGKGERGEREGKGERGGNTDTGETDGKGEREVKGGKGERKDKGGKEEIGERKRKGEIGGREESGETGRKGEKSKRERRGELGKEEKGERKGKEEREERKVKGETGERKGKEERVERKYKEDRGEKFGKEEKRERKGKEERQGKEVQDKTVGKEERERMGKNERGERKEKGERGENGERSRKADKGEKGPIRERGERLDKGEKSDREGRETRKEKSERGEKAERREEGEKREKKEIEERSGKGEKIEKDGALKRDDKNKNGGKTEPEIGKVDKLKKSQTAQSDTERSTKDKKQGKIEDLKVKSETEKNDEKTRLIKEHREKEIDEKHDQAKFNTDKEDQKIRDLIQKAKDQKGKGETVGTEIAKKGKTENDEKKIKKGKKDKLAANDKEMGKDKKVKSKPKEAEEITKGKNKKDREKTDIRKSIGKDKTGENINAKDDKSTFLQRFKLPEEMTMSAKDQLKLDQVKVPPDENDLYLKLVKLKQLKYKGNKPKGLLPKLSALLHRHHSHFNKVRCPFCQSSDLQFVAEDLIRGDQEEDEIIIGTKIHKYKPYLVEKPKEPGVVPLFYKTTFYAREPTVLKPEHVDIKPAPQSPSNENATTKSAKSPQAKTGDQTTAAPKGITRYALSDRSFIDRGWTMLPTEKVVKKMNVYRMRPAQPEFDWFKHNRKKQLITYDTGEKLAEFSDDGRGRWYYRNGRIALDYYDAEEANAQQRLVIYSSGVPDSRGRSRPFTILATFDYLGNGIVLDHSGKIRMKYNQSEGVILDRSLGPVTHWKWHTLNDPPVLQQIMVDTKSSHKDPDIMKLGSGLDKPVREVDEEMLAIEFDNFIKEKSKKLSQTFQPFKIKMKAIKINEHFSLKVLDQATVYLIYRDGTTHIKLNIGMKLDHKEILDTDTSELGDVSNNIERLPARSESLNWIQKKLRGVQRYDQVRSERERRLQHPVAKSSADILTAATSRPLQTPIHTVPSSSSVPASKCYCSRKPTKNNVYYDTSVF